MRRFFRGAVAVVLLTCGIASSQADLITLSPEGDIGKDASIADGSRSTSNMGDYGRLIINWSGNPRTVGLIEFDLGNVPTGVHVTSATLSLFHHNNASSGTQYDVFRVTSFWDETSVTFDTAPTFDPIATSSMFIGDANTGLYRSWDVTSLVAGWVDDSYLNFGMWIEEVPIGGGGTAMFLSSDSSSGRPALEIVYEPLTHVPEPGSIAAMLSLATVAAGAAWARRRRRKYSHDLRDRFPIAGGRTQECTAVNSPFASPE